MPQLPLLFTLPPTTFSLPSPVSAGGTKMHIMEGFLPATHAASWGIVALACVGVGLRSINKAVQEQPEVKILLGVATAFTFILSALKLPSLTGSCSHPTGTGLGAILFGPLAMAPVAAIVLLFQALLLAHGGLTTLGANIFSMGVIGPLVGYGCYRLGKRAALPLGLTVFVAAISARRAQDTTPSIDWINLKCGESLPRVHCPWRLLARS